jgi:hypothetical protein
MTRSRRSPLLWLFSATLAIAFVSALVFTPSTALAQAAADSANTSAPAVNPTVGADVAAMLTAFITPLVAKWPWVSTVLLAFGGFSAVWNAVIAFLHQRAAATTDVQDDNWVASLEAKWWFRLCDRIAYCGGYLGAWLGGKKL